MKTKKILFACFVMVALTGCGKDGGIANLFIPNFSNLWKSSRETFFTFKPDDANLSSGKLSGDEDGRTFKGSYDNYDIKFSFDNEQAIIYTGQIIKDSKPLSMKVKGTNNVELTITKLE